MKSLRITFVVGLISCLALSGCSPTDSTTPAPIAPSTSATATATVIPQQEGGANAAPQVQTTLKASDFFDLSTQARDNFWQWWSYEVQVQADADKPFQTVYGNGLGVCLQRAKNVNPTAIAETWERQLGYTASGGHAIVKAALQALCPKYDTGFTTYFDGNVDRFIAGASKEITYSGAKPQFYEYGYFLKEACSYIIKYGNQGIFDHMVNSRDRLSLIKNVNDAMVIKLYLQEALITCGGHYDVNW